MLSTMKLYAASYAIKIYKQQTRTNNKQGRRAGAAIKIIVIYQRRTEGITRPMHGFG